jgi:Heterokaryon incompatibility protein (HET)
MPASNLQYQYQPLVGKREFRLFKLDTSGSSRDSLIECFLTTYELSDKKHPEYNTLSYHWGEPVLNCPILVNGAQLMINHNLFEAIQQLREYQLNGIVSTVFWWIDMICINQKDVTERGHQVSKMRDIFQRSILTVAWIGPAADDSDRAMEILRARSDFHEPITILKALFNRPY